MSNTRGSSDSANGAALSPSAFLYCLATMMCAPLLSMLSSVVIPGDATRVLIHTLVRAVLPKAFQDSSDLVEVKLLGRFKLIGVGAAFRGCASLLCVNTLANITTIGNVAFWGCKLLEEANLGKGLQTIGLYAFYKCTSLLCINIPPSITDMG